MKLSTKGRYGLRAMLELAMNYGGKPVLLKNIAGKQEVSVRYLENIMTVMVSSGLVTSMRGKNGGFRLNKAPADIKASDIIQLLEGSLAPVGCVDNPALCTRTDGCVTHDIWERIKKAMFDVLDELTLEDMVKLHMEKEKMKSSGKNLYYI